MDIIAIELLLWAVLIFFFWALKDGLGEVETDIESFGLFRPSPSRSLRPALRMEKPEKMIESMGNYMGSEIFRYAIIGGEQYEFDRISPEQDQSHLRETERYLEPGLVYVHSPSKEQQMVQDS